MSSCENRSEYCCYHLSDHNGHSTIKLADSYNEVIKIGGLIMSIMLINFRFYAIKHLFDIGLTSKSYDTLQDETKRIWKLQFHGVVREFSTSSITLPPFNLLFLPISICSLLRTKLRNSNMDSLQKYSKSLLNDLIFRDDILF